MPEQPAAWEHDMLEQFARTFPYPPTPEIAPRVAASLAVPPAPARWWPRLAAAVALLALAFAITLTASKGARDAVAGFLGLAVEGERIEVLPTPLPDSLPTPFPSPVEIEHFATPVTLEEATLRAGFEPARVPSLEALEVYLLEPSGAAPVVILRYPGFDLWQFQTSGQPDFGKGVISGRIVEETTVAGHPAYWIEGGERLVSFLDDNGQPIAGTQRTVLAPTLIWHDGERYLRIEGTPTRQAAIAIAQSIH